MNQVTLLKIATGVLLCLNLGAVYMLWSHRQPPPPAEYLVHELKFDDAQRDRFYLLRDDHRQSIRQLQDRMGHLQQELPLMLASGGPDSTRAALWADSIGACQQAMARITAEHFSRVRALCRPEQQQRFDAIIGDVLRNMAPHKRPRG